MLALKNKYLWQEALSDIITDPEELLSFLDLDVALLEEARAAARVFPLKVTRGFAARMQKGDRHDPLLLQVLPIGLELNETPGFTADPLEEINVNPVPGLLHKYHGRVLVTLTSACAVHCRYCFRRHFPYEDNNPGTNGWEKIFAYIKQHDTINEMILSGGDPLSVNDKLLKSFTDQLIQIKHVTRLRIHTRLPIVLPERITDELITWIQQVPLDVVMVVHANHPNEINDDVRHALLKLRQAGVHLLNQTVLLKRVNDDIDTLVALSETLFSAGVLPYYLHTLDKIQGAAHFDIPLQEAQALYAQMTKKLSGYLVPRLVCEEPGMPAKTLLSTGLYTG